MNNWFIYAQIFGLFGMVIQVSSFIHNNKQKLLVYQIFSNILYGFQYLLLNATGGFIMSLICIIRNFIFFKYSISKNVLFAIWFSIIMCSIIFCDNFIDCLPMIAVIIYSYALYQENLKITRMIDIIACILCIIYDSVCLAIGSVISYVIEMIVVIVTIHKYDLKRDKNVR